MDLHESLTQPPPGLNMVFGADDNSLLSSVSRSHENKYIWIRIDRILGPCTTSLQNDRTHKSTHQHNSQIMEIVDIDTDCCIDIVAGYISSDLLLSQISVSTAV